MAKTFNLNPGSDATLVAAATRAAMANVPKDLSGTFESMAEEYGKTMREVGKSWAQVGKNLGTIGGQLAEHLPLLFFQQHYQSFLQQPSWFYHTQKP